MDESPLPLKDNNNQPLSMDGGMDFNSTKSDANHTCPAFHVGVCECGKYRIAEGLGSRYVAAQPSPQVPQAAAAPSLFQPPSMVQFAPMLQDGSPIPQLTLLRQPIRSSRIAEREVEILTCQSNRGRRSRARPALPYIPIRVQQDGPALQAAPTLPSPQPSSAPQYASSSPNGNPITQPGLLTLPFFSSRAALKAGELLTATSAALRNAPVPVQQRGPALPSMQPHCTQQSARVPQDGVPVARSGQPNLPDISLPVACHSNVGDSMGSINRAPRFRITSLNGLTSRVALPEPPSHKSRYVSGVAVPMMDSFQSGSTSEYRGPSSLVQAPQPLAGSGDNGNDNMEISGVQERLLRAQQSAKATPSPSSIRHAIGRAIFNKCLAAAYQPSPSQYPSAAQPSAENTATSQISMIFPSTSMPANNQPKLMLEPDESFLQPYRDESLARLIIEGYAEVLRLWRAIHRPPPRARPRRSRPIENAPVNEGNLQYFPPQDKSFHLFTRLPSEIRRKIWRQVLPGPRTIAIGNWHLDRVIYGTSANIHHLGVRPPVTQVIPTPLLHTCFESREICMEKYSLINFGKESPNVPGSTVKHAYVNFKEDLILALELKDLIYMVQSPEELIWKQKVERLVLADITYVNEDLQDLVSKILGQMPKVTELGFLEECWLPTSRNPARETTDMVKRRFERFWDRDKRVVRPELVFRTEGALRQLIEEMPADQAVAFLWYGRGRRGLL